MISHVKPKWFVMENVDRIAKSKIIEPVLDIFHQNEYGLTSVILNASLCGVPQARKRYFLCERI
ncbi:MAG: hypothetical protein HC777_00210 [Hyphomonadaceae bacterium]|nr:hypothetical protein [Hyphomonadaceae bacterium]